MTDRQPSDTNNSPIVPVGVGLAVGVGFILLFSIFGTKGISSIPQPNPGEVSPSTIPSDFTLVYAYGVGKNNILNTANNTYTHDMICDPPIVINFTLSDSELASIWNSVQQNNYFQLKNLTDACPNSSPFDRCIGIIPENEYSFTISANGKSHAVELRENYELNQGQDSSLHKFKEVTITIDGILSQRAELKQLPKPRCGYE